MEHKLALIKIACLFESVDHEALSQIERQTLTTAVRVLGWAYAVDQYGQIRITKTEGSTA